MGTRSITHIKEDGKTIATIYRQYDGYPSGHGSDLLEMLQGIKLTNGFGFGAKYGEVANGMGCLAALVISELKSEQVGGVYIYPPKSQNVGEEYIYTIKEKNGKINLKCVDVWNKKTLFNDTVENLTTKELENA